MPSLAVRIMLCPPAAAAARHARLMMASLRPAPAQAAAAELIELPASYRNDGKLSMEWEVAPATTEADRASTATCRAVAHHGPARTARTATSRRRRHRAEAQPGSASERPQSRHSARDSKWLPQRPGPRARHRHDS